MDTAIAEKCAKIKLLILDVDGVLVQPYFLLGGVAKEVQIYRIYCIHDAPACWIAKKAGLKMAILSGRDVADIRERAAICKIDEADCFFGQLEKLSFFENLKEKYNLRDEETAFVTDDILDIPLLRKVGLKVAVNNAVEEVKEMADIITQSRGGEGAVREIIRMILTAQGKWDIYLAEVLNDIYHQDLH